MAFVKDADIDPTPLAGKKVAIVGYGNQGRAQALNLHDSKVDVVVGLRGGSGSRFEAEAAGLETALLEDAVAAADVVMMLAPDEIHAALYAEIEPHLRHGAALGFSHGLSVRFGFIEPRSDLDVYLLAPKGPGTALRSLYTNGKGMIALWAVEQDATGNAKGIALAYGRAIGCGRAGLIESSFAEEAEAAALRVALIEDAVAQADVVMLLAPDEIHGALYREIEPHLRHAAALALLGPKA